MANTSSQVGYPPQEKKGSRRERVARVIAGGVACWTVPKEFTSIPSVRLESDEPLPSDFHSNCIIASMFGSIKERSLPLAQIPLSWAGEVRIEGDERTLTAVLDGEIPPIIKSRGIRLISANSPLGRALSGASQIGEVEYRAPGGVHQAIVVAVYD